MRNRRGSIFEAVVTDGHGRLTLTFFGNRSQAWREKELQPGLRGLFSGQVSSFRGKRQLTHPDYEMLGAGESDARAAEYAAELIPIYPATGKLASWQIADSVRIALDVLDAPDDPLPAAVRRAHELIGYADALRGIHRPADWTRSQPVPEPPEVGRGPRSCRSRWPSAAARPPPTRRSAAAPRRGRAAGRLRRRAAVRAHRRPAAGRGHHRRRAGPRTTR